MTGLFFPGPKGWMMGGGLAYISAHIYLAHTYVHVLCSMRWISRVVHVACCVLSGALYAMCVGLCVFFYR